MDTEAENYVLTMQDQDCAAPIDILDYVNGIGNGRRMLKIMLYIRMRAVYV